MIAAKRSIRPGTLLAILATTLALAGTASAEAVKTVNGVDIDSTVFETYLQSRLQKPADQATPDERTQVLNEMTDIYLLSTQASAKELEKDPVSRPAGASSGFRLHEQE